MNRKKLNLLPIVLEALFVVLGVVLALGANEWRENAKRTQHAETALVSIYDELEVNRSSVISTLEYHLLVSDSLRTYLSTAATRGQDISMFPNSRLFSKGYIFPANLLRTAWDTASSTDAVSNMPYDDVLDLSRVYELHEDYEFQSQQAGQLIYERLFNEGQQGMLRNYSNLLTMIYTFVFRECELLTKFDTLLLKVPAVETDDNPDVSRYCNAMSNR